MRHRGFYIGILLLALLTGGWGSVLAAALCVHDASAQPLAVAEDHACCRARLEQPPEHCAAEESAHAAHEAMATDEMAAMPGPAAEQSAGVAVALGRNAGACLHCASHNGLPRSFAAAREPEQKKRHASAAVASVTKTPAPLIATFARPLPKGRGAPPGNTGRRHLLLSVFVI
jgi:hypothetical protein